MEHNTHDYEPVHKWCPFRKPKDSQEHVKDNCDGVTQRNPFIETVSVKAVVPRRANASERYQENHLHTHKMFCFLSYYKDSHSRLKRHYNWQIYNSQNDTRKSVFSIILSCYSGVDLKYLRAERSSEFLVLIVSSPEIKSPSSFGGLCIKQTYT